MNQSNNTEDVSLFCILLGCTPKGRNIEQHDVMFGVANTLQGLTDDMKNFWYNNIIDEVSASLKKQLPGLDNQQFSSTLLKTLSRRDKVHVDAWMKVEYASGYKVQIRKKHSEPQEDNLKLYFINLGGYKENEFEEFHKKLFVAATAVSDALQQVMHHPFMKEHSPAELGIAGGAHLDDQHKIEFEADDIVCVSDAIGNEYELVLEKADSPKENEMAIGYVRLDYGDNAL
jgi:hypothetical protein